MEVHVLPPDLAAGKGLVELRMICRGHGSQVENGGNRNSVGDDLVPTHEL